MPRRGRPLKWMPTSAAPTPVLTQISQWTRDAQEYAAFSRAAGLRLGPQALLAYASSQEAAGMSRNAIANRLEALRNLRDDSFTEQMAAHALSERIRTLRTATARSGGPKRKALVSITTLQRWLAPTDDERDRRYQCLWWFLLCTGARPEEHHRAKCKVTDTALYVQWNGRKGNYATSAQYLRYAFDWAVAPSPQVLSLVSAAPESMAVKIGTPKNCAACLNSWLKSFARRHAFDSQDITSTFPRVRLDNVLRSLHDEGELTAIEFQALIGHTLETSQSSYRR